LDGEKLQLKTELAELRRDVTKFTNDGRNGEGVTETYGANGSFHSVNLEQEYQKRLVAFLEPLKTSLHQGLDSLIPLTENLTNAMNIATAPARRSKSLSAINFSRDQEMIRNIPGSVVITSDSQTVLPTPNMVPSSNVQSLTQRTVKEASTGVSKCQLQSCDTIAEESDESYSSRRKSSLMPICPLTPDPQLVLTLEENKLSGDESVSSPDSDAKIYQMDNTSQEMDISTSPTKTKLMQTSTSIYDISDNDISPEIEDDILDIMTRYSRKKHSDVLSSNSECADVPKISVIDPVENISESKQDDEKGNDFSSNKQSPIDTTPEHNTKNQKRDSPINTTPEHNTKNQQRDSFINTTQEHNAKNQKRDSAKVHNDKENETSREKTIVRPKRKAASAIANFKEPSIGKKLRRA
jgi:hypothetical protein